MQLRFMIFKLSVIYGVMTRISGGKRSRLFVPVIDESDLTGLGDDAVWPGLSNGGASTRNHDLSRGRAATGKPDPSDIEMVVGRTGLSESDDGSVLAIRANPLDVFDVHIRRILDDLATTEDPPDGENRVSTNHSSDRKHQLPQPSPSCITYPKKSSGFEPCKSGIRKRSRYKLSEPARDSSTRDIIAQLDDEIAEQEMDKRSRIELLAYLDAAIKNKNIELNLELRHLAKEEEILNLRDQDYGDTDKNVMMMNSNIAQLNKRIKDLDERIVCMNRLKEERTAQEAAIWRDTLDKSSSYNLTPDKLGDNIPMAVRKVVPQGVASKVKAVPPNALPGVLTSNSRAAPAVPPNVLPGPLTGPYVDPSVFALPNAHPGSWWPVVAPQPWDRMFSPRWDDRLPAYQDNNRLLPPLLPFLPHPQSDTSDLVEYED
ncbi:hypothetical protein GE061_020106 [Apolygus lucorum]|uniref:Uncharacterized protein n=1 Tax=Apolygus lucorum TaxID=248454 RepID=A0A6A4J970_APOLU|nr:hypothetical protein GE061_020106 [Apolygus lucorum]